MSRTRLTAEFLEERLTPSLADLIGTLRNPLANIGDNFGLAVAVDGNLAVVGVPGDDPGGVTNAGSAYVFDITTGALVATLNNPAPAASDNFGISVAISGTGVVVGADADDPGGVPDAGSAYVFDISTSSIPAPLATLNNPSPTANEYFGVSVGISGTRVVVGAIDAPGGVIFAGSAYVFDLLAGPTPFPFATLNNPTPAVDDFFGTSVGISGLRVVVGASGDDPGGVTNAGSAYVFDVSTGSTPPPLATLNNPSPAADDFFGASVGISGLRVVVGSPGDDPGGVTNSGSAYVFDFTSGPTPPPLATLTNPAPAADDSFGNSVGISGTRVVVGASQDDASGVTNAGSAYEFDFTTGPAPAPLATLANPTPAADDFFGNSVAVGGARVVVGGVADDPGGVTDGGSAYVFDGNPPPAALDDAFIVPAGSGATILPVLGNDTAAPDTGETLSVLVFTQPAVGGVVTGGGPGLTFTPAAGFSGTAVFTYTVVDGNGGADTATVTVTVLPAPPRPAPPPRLAVGGANGVVTVFAAVGGQFDSSPPVPRTPFAGFTGPVRTATGDVNGDGFADTIVVTGPGTPIRVAVLSGADNSAVLVAPFDPFGGDFLGGGYVAAGDLDGDGRAEFVVTPDQGGGPRVTVFSLNPDGTLTTRANFLGIDDPNFRGGARAAVGDVNGDGTPDVVVAAGFGGGPRTAIFTGQSVLAGTPARLVGDFFAFPGSDAVTLRNGSFVAAGDVTGDGFVDLVFGGGPGGAPRVFILSGALVSAGDVAGAQAAPVANFFVAGDSADRGGVRVAAKDADGDGRADVAVGSGEGSPSRVRVYLGTNFSGAGEPAAFQDLDPFGGATLVDGVFVG